MFSIFKKTFDSRDVSCTLSRVFFRLGFRLLCVCLAVHYLAIFVGFKFKEFKCNCRYNQIKEIEALTVKSMNFLFYSVILVGSTSIFA